MWDDTLIIVTADHGEMLGDHGLREKLGYWEESYCDPRASCATHRSPRRTARSSIGSPRTST